MKLRGIVKNELLNYEKVPLTKGVSTKKKTRKGEFSVENDSKTKLIRNFVEKAFYKIFVFYS